MQPLKILVYIITYALTFSRILNFCICTSQKTVKVTAILVFESILFWVHTLNRSLWLIKIKIETQQRNWGGGCNTNNILCIINFWVYITYRILICLVLTMICACFACDARLSRHANSWLDDVRGVQCELSVLWQNRMLCDTKDIRWIPTIRLVWKS